MGGAIGDVLWTGTRAVSTAASLLGDDSAEKNYYRSMAAVAQAQARQTEENAKRNLAYTLQDASYQNRQLADQYNSLLGTQKSALAANGLGSHSATAQLILKNSRLNAQLDQEMLAQNFNRSMQETQTAASLQAQQYRLQAQQYKRAQKNRLGIWGKMGTAVTNFFSAFGGE